MPFPNLISTPELTGDQYDDLARLDDLRRRLALQVSAPTRWAGTLRRLARVESETSSTSIEGYSVTIPQALEIMAGRRGETARPEDEMALRCYHQAMDRVLSLADEPAFAWSQQLLLDLHFMTIYFQRDRLPGRYRRRGIAVTGPDGGIAYQRPPSDEVPGLMGELIEWLETGDVVEPPLVRAAMAHLHLVSIHPFADGNGRMARILQSLVLAREGVLHPELASIEHHLATNTGAYHGALQATHGPVYDPATRSASPWLDFCIEAHLAEARRLHERVALIHRRNTFCEEVAGRQGYPDRFVSALDQVLMGLPLTNAEYRSEHGIAAITAAGDLRRLVVDGWLVPEGGGRSARYRAAARLQEAWLERENAGAGGRRPGRRPPASVV
jgi:Fic family protein